jgi:tetratricopeptide (TPR) repeat protein
LSKRGSMIPRALEFFKRAVALDNEYALAWAGLADCYTLLDFYGFIKPETEVLRAKDAAKRAVTLDPSLSEAHSANACACLLYDRDFPAAEREFLLALELNPRYVQARDWYAFFYLQVAVGRFEEGIVQAKIALESDPLSGYANALLGMTYLNAGKFAEALQAFEQALELDPDSFLARWSLQNTLHLSGRFQEAVSKGEEVLTIAPFSWLFVAAWRHRIPTATVSVPPTWAHPRRGVFQSFFCWSIKGGGRRPQLLTATLLTGRDQGRYMKNC